uniref:Uncharacterized protein n=1 Tax=Arion vulgaris TaxID=1028688 RepID=A0A0B7ANX3_9EUPU
MSPCSSPLHSRHRNKILLVDIHSNPLTREEHMLQEMVGPVWSCQGAKSSSSPQKIDNKANNCFFQIHPFKSTVQTLCSQCDKLNCMIVINISKLGHQMPLDNQCQGNNIACVLNRPAERQVNLQQEIVLHANNRPEDDELQNDSGFGSGGLQRNFIFDSESDLDQLKKNDLELSQCGFYFGSIDSQTSNNLLRKKPTGTFLLRDSSDSRYLYSLSVKTEKGATSIRILYNNGMFQFDCDERIRYKLPQFDSLLALLNFHVKATEKGGNKMWRWEEISGCKSLTVVLKKSLMNSVPSLAHLSRVKINQCLDNVDYLPLAVEKLPLSSDLKKFVQQYPYQI